MIKNSIALLLKYINIKDVVILFESKRLQINRKLRIFEFNFKNISHYFKDLGLVRFKSQILQNILNSIKSVVIFIDITLYRKILRYFF